MFKSKKLKFNILCKILLDLSEAEDTTGKYCLLRLTIQQKSH